MSSDDDTFLSAYLDGQLDSNQQHLVDSALASRPELAERLRGLTLVRDLVVGLPRDTGIDVTPMVMNRIRLRSRSFFSRDRPWRSQARRAAAVAGLLTAAAGIVLMVTIATYLQSRVQRVPTAAPAALDNIVADSRSSGVDTSAIESVATVIMEPRTSPFGTLATRPVAHNRQPSALGHDAAVTDQNGQLEAADLELSRTMLDKPGQRRFFLIKSGTNGKAQQQVASVVEHTTRFGFFKITVSQGIVIDPRHPEEATVFALVVNPNELDQLRDQLKVAMPDIIEEKAADPAIVTQLADIGRVESLAPVPLADVLISREALALRTRVGSRGDSAAQLDPTSAQKRSSRPTAEQFRSAPVPTQGRSGSSAETEHGSDLAAADEVAHLPDASTPSGAQSSNPVPGSEVAMAKPDLAGHALTLAQKDEMILVFVWICKADAS